MYGTIFDEKTVDVPATEAWKLFSSPQLSKVIKEAMPDFIGRVDVVQGDGGVGTIAEMVFQLGGTWKSLKEKLMVLDHEKRVREVEIVEGGFLDLGFTLYRVRFEVIEVEGNEKQCIIRYTIEYELKEEAVENIALVSIQSLIAIVQHSAQYLLRNNGN
ncbi:norbelladine synthase-like [Salvia hispanica]|uniref:norbelladine synthase-like n=1 Tax=Salvia hispanica TaxID=49212 RepID=UPI002009B35E|nr:norbelladine synthase-like [Salvia hispanica]